MDKAKLIEYMAKKLAGKEVQVIRRKLPDKWLPGLTFEPFTIKGTITQVNLGEITLKQSSGMSQTLKIKDEYFITEGIFEDVPTQIPQ